MTIAPSPPAPEPDRQSRRVPARLVVASEWAWRGGLVAGAVVAAGWLFLYLRIVTVPAFVAVLATSVLHPLVDRLRQRQWPTLLATWTVLAGAVASIVAAGFVLVPLVADDTNNLDEQLQGGIAEVEHWLETGPLGLDNVDLRASIDRAVDRFIGSEEIVDGVTLAGEIVAGALLAIVMTFFFLKDGPAIVARLRTAIPAPRRPDADRAGRAAWTALGAYMRGTAIIGIVNGTIIGLGLAVIGVPLAVPLAVITAISAFFPLVGAVVAGAIAALVALFAGGVTDALLVLGLVVVVQQVEGDVLSPVVMGRALRLHPLTILVALTAGATVAGILGAFLAIPFVGVAAAAIGAASTRPEPPEP